MKTHDHMKPFQCAICNRGYNTAAALTSHMQNHKRNNSNNNGQTQVALSANNGISVTTTTTVGNSGQLAACGHNNNNNGTGSANSTANNSIKGREPLLSIQRDNKNNKESAQSDSEDDVVVEAKRVRTTQENVNAAAKVSAAPPASLIAMSSALENSPTACERALALSRMNKKRVAKHAREKDDEPRQLSFYAYSASRIPNSIFL